MTGGTYIAFMAAPNAYGHTMTGVSLGNFVPTLGTWSCQEGTFGPAVGASLCGNYNFGSNKTNQSTYTPTAQGATVTLGGDDGAVGTPQSMASAYSYMTAVAVSGAPTGYQYYCLFNGQPNATPSYLPPGYSSPCEDRYSGYQFAFMTAAVPIPPAVWLFGSALGLMGAMRRKIGS